MKNGWFVRENYFLLHLWYGENVWKGYANIINYLWSIERCEVNLSAMMGRGSPIMQYFESVPLLWRFRIETCKDVHFVYQIVFLTFFFCNSTLYYHIMNIRLGLKGQGHIIFGQGHKCFDYVLSYCIFDLTAFKVLLKKIHSFLYISHLFTGFVE